MFHAKTALPSAPGKFTASASWYPVLKAAIFALLIWNTASYLFGGALSKAIDAAAWLILLSLFELEAGLGARLRGQRAAMAIRYSRLAAAGAVGVAAIRYFFEGEWLDVINTVLWITVVVLLEFEMRYPRAVARRHGWFTTTAVVLYTGLAILVPLWAWRGEWFDAYDALLWLAAFAMIEMEVLRISGRHATT